MVSIWTQADISGPLGHKDETPSMRKILDLEGEDDFDDLFQTQCCDRAGLEHQAFLPSWESTRIAPVFMEVCQKLKGSWTDRKLE